jgi:hypothetical protein
MLSLLYMRLMRLVMQNGYVFVKRLTMLDFELSYRQGKPEWPVQQANVLRDCGGPRNECSAHVSWAW